MIEFRWSSAFAPLGAQLSLQDRSRWHHVDIRGPLLPKTVVCQRLKWFKWGSSRTCSEGIWTLQTHPKHLLTLQRDWRTRGSHIRTTERQKSLFSIPARSKGSLLEAPTLLRDLQWTQVYIVKNKCPGINCVVFCSQSHPKFWGSGDPPGDTTCQQTW